MLQNTTETGRLKRADGSLSDMVNLTRAREALASFAERQRP
jgi:hypothetical protein